MTARMYRVSLHNIIRERIQECSVSGTVTGHMGGDGSMVFPEFGGIAGQNELAGIISGCTAA